MLKLLKERGYFFQATRNIEKALEKPCTVYIGFDCTADSLHVGSLVQIMVLRLLKRLGFRVIILLGDGTTSIGDPSGRDKTRPTLSQEEINHNCENIKEIFEKFGFIDFIFNSYWKQDIDFLEIGRYITIPRMLSFDSVKIRENLTLTEFLYMIVQGYDFLHLSRHYNCILQIGGSDQWGNIVNGIELARRIDGKEIYGLTTPLITTSSGEKMGKTVSGAIWLSEEKLSPYDYWQFWRNTKDEDVGKFLRLFTDIPINDIEVLESLKGSEINNAKIILANAATTICHSKEAATMAYSKALQKYKK